MDHDLPFVDEHHVVAAAPAATVWRCLAAHLAKTGGSAAEAYGLLVGAVPRRTSGTPLTEGATLPGFTVTEADREHHVRLTGRHRFSRYTLDLDLAPGPGGTRLTARTHAAFPGVLGAVYRTAVITSGAHRVLVGRLLRTVARHAEAVARGAAGP